MSFIYLYCLLPAAGDVSVEAIEGMEPGSAVRLIDAGQLRAAVSEVGDDFAEAQLNARVRDLDWLSPRAVRHHDVVDQLYARCKLMLPLAFGSIFSSLESLRQRLQEQEQELLGRLAMLRQREQWDLKLTRDRPTFGAELARHSPPLADLEAELAAKPPGTRFLLEKKRQTVHAREAQRLSAAVRADVHQALSACAVDAERDQLAKPSEPQSIELELRASYLVQEDAVDRLKTIASELAGKYAPLGYMFELTGPWPPFSFAGGLSEVLRGQWAAHD